MDRDENFEQYLIRMFNQVIERLDGIERRLPAVHPELLEALKEVLGRLHSNGVYSFNRVKAMEILLKRRPDLWKEFEDALHEVQKQDVHRDFGSLLDKIQ